MRQLILVVPLALLLVGATSVPSVQYQLEWLTIIDNAKSEGVVNANVTATIRNTGVAEGNFFHAWFLIDDGDIQLDSRSWEEWLPKGRFNFYLPLGESKVISWAPQVRLSLPKDFCTVPFKVALSVEAVGKDHSTGWMVPYCDRGGTFMGWKPYKEEAK